MSKIGIYGGTFDPIHHGHLILAREAREQLQLDEIIFIPAAQSPHKPDVPATPAAVRLEMLRAATADEPFFSIDGSELNRPPPSFTINTVEDFARLKPDAKLFYLIGSDNLPRLPSWHRIGELETLVEFVVLDRGGHADDSSYRTIRRPIDISATEIRKKVAEGRSIRYLVPPAVAEIIQRHQLYQDTQKSPRKN
ncbi:MAG: nicotinate-nucleotide adenylyltransferase [Chthoniobacterales bacterium]